MQVRRAGGRPGRGRDSSPRPGKSQESLQDIYIYLSLYNVYNVFVYIYIYIYIHTHTHVHVIMSVIIITHGHY